MDKRQTGKRTDRQKRTTLNFNYAQPYLDIQQFVATIGQRERKRVWFGSVWFEATYSAKQNELPSFTM